MLSVKDPGFSYVELERVRCAVRRAMDRYGLTTCPFPELRLGMLDDMGYTLIADLFEDPTQRCRKAILAHSPWVPADWWQHVKERWAPRWFLKKWPVKKKRLEVTFDAEFRVLFPDVVARLGDKYPPRLTMAVLAENKDWVESVA